MDTEPEESVGDWNELLASFGSTDFINKIGSTNSMVKNWVGYAGIIGLRYYISSRVAVDLKSGFLNNNYQLLIKEQIFPYMSFNVDTFITAPYESLFIYSKNDENEELEEQNTLNVLKRKTVTSLSYKYLRLKRKHDYILKINENLEERNNKLLTIISGNLQYNFGMVNR